MQDEVRTVFAPNANDGEPELDVAKLLALPLLQSVYTEVLRLHISVSLPRSATAPLVMDGFAIRKGAVLFAPAHVAHRSEASWGRPGHPAGAFWGERHVREGAGGVREFRIAGEPEMFFPYGGGTGICPGRHFAKQEIFMVVAVLLSKFDVEFVEWTMMDGAKADRPALDDERFAGAAGMPPDRDMKVRLTRRW